VAWKEEGLNTEEIDDTGHLQAFISEIQPSPEASNPNFLKQFREFEDLARAITERLNLGQSLSDTILRRALVIELQENLARMVERYINTVFPHDSWMLAVRKESNLTTDNLAQALTIWKRHFRALSSPLIGIARITGLGSQVLDEILEAGIFLEFDPAENSLKETPVHNALAELRRDILWLAGLDQDTEWSVSILEAIRSAAAVGHTYCVIPGLYMAKALSFYDRADDVFNAHVAVLRHLTGMTDSLEPIPRSPATPLGSVEEHNIWAEMVTSIEVVKLIGKDIWPLGKRAIRPHSENLKAAVEDRMIELAQAMGLDLNIDEHSRKGILDTLIESLTAAPEEGIEFIKRRTPSSSRRINFEPLTLPDERQFEGAFCQVTADQHSPVTVGGILLPNVDRKSVRRYDDRFGAIVSDRTTRTRTHHRTPAPATPS
jgi:hypothetical protein